jgi:diacylglycerol kinase family enzyme
MIHVILNPASGAASKPETTEQVTTLFEAAGVPAQIHRVSTPAAISDEVRRVLNCRTAIDAVVAGGPTPLGVLPLGTLNHFAKDLGIPLDLPKAVDVIAQGHTAPVDVGRVNDRIFVNNSSIGIYPDIVERRERLRAQGSRKWPALMRATLEVLQREREVSVRLDTGGQQIASRTPFVFVGNNEYQLEGIHLGARSRLDAGRLFAYLAPRVHTRDLPKLLAHALMGRARRERGLMVFSAPELWIETPNAGNIKVACDGELLTLTMPLHYSSWPRALNVLVPAAAA